MLLVQAAGTVGPFVQTATVIVVDPDQLVCFVAVENSLRRYVRPRTC